MSGTDIAYGAAAKFAYGLFCKQNASDLRRASLSATRVLCDVRYCRSVWCYGGPSGTDLAYGGTIFPCAVGVWCQLPLRRLRVRTPTRYPSTRFIGDVRYWDRRCYAMPGTEIGYAATRGEEREARGEKAPVVWSAIGLRACYAMSGTEIAYVLLSAYARAMRCPALR
eukprot:3604468-Rhodomonas_salina.4